MKTQLRLLLIGCIVGILINCSDDENFNEVDPDPISNEGDGGGTTISRIEVNFVLEEFQSILEGENPLEVKLRFSKPATADGTIRIFSENSEELNFTNISPLSARSFSVAYSNGDSEISFKVNKSDDQIFNEHDLVRFSINNDSKIYGGTFNKIEIDVIDNEWKGLPKFITTIENGIAQHWKQFYYGKNEKISRFKNAYINQTNYDANNTLYKYDENDSIIGTYSYGDTFSFLWENGKIVKTKANNIVWYGPYDIYYKYNSAGHISETESIFSDGWLDKKSYSYLTNGNLEKMETLGEINNSGAFEVVESTTYEYTTNPNLFPLIEIIPTQQIQLHFPQSKTVINNLNPSYNNVEIYEYEFDDQGRVIAQWSGNKPSGYTRMEFSYY